MQLHNDAVQPNAKMGEGNYPPGAKIEVENDQFDPNSAGLK